MQQIQPKFTMKLLMLIFCCSKSNISHTLLLILNEKGSLKITENNLHEQLYLANDKMTTSYLKEYQQGGSVPLLNKIGSNHLNIAD